MLVVSDSLPLFFAYGTKHVTLILTVALSVAQQLLATTRLISTVIKSNTWRLISPPADTIGAKKEKKRKESFSAGSGSQSATGAGRKQEKPAAHQEAAAAALPFPRVTTRGWQWVDPRSAQSISPSVRPRLLLQQLIHFPAEEKYLQPVESMRQESVHRSCPKDLQGA